MSRLLALVPAALIFLILFLFLESPHSIRYDKLGNRNLEDVHKECTRQAQGYAPWYKECYRDLSRNLN